MAADKTGSNPPKTYEQVLGELGAKRPRLGAALARAHANRTKALTRLQEGARLGGIEQLLSHLDAVAAQYEALAPLKRVAFLVQRAIEDFELGADAVLSGMRSVVADSMRDIMEIEFLLRDFRLHPDHIDQWLRADQKELLRTFAPRELRRRFANSLKKEPKDLSEATDYAAHSSTLHVSPRPIPFARRGIQATEDRLANDMGFWELFEHARRVLWEFDSLARSMVAEKWTATSPESLEAVKSGWERTQEMQALLLAAAAGRRRRRSERRVTSASHSRGGSPSASRISEP
jgi:hypothetical protein